MEYQNRTPLQDTYLIHAEGRNQNSPSVTTTRILEMMVIYKRLDGSVVVQSFQQL